MQDALATLKTLNRPKLLVRAARTALTNFKRESSLARIFGHYGTFDGPEVLEELLAKEDEFNQLRKTGDATYSIARHITVLTALMSEASSAIQSNDAFT